VEAQLPCASSGELTTKGKGGPVCIEKKGPEVAQVGSRTFGSNRQMAKRSEREARETLCVIMGASVIQTLNADGQANFTISAAMLRRAGSSKSCRK
jgi:hypothetical protein